jgi:multidrug efflux pump subunit AcrA (membrane-fusion protein)
MIGRDWINDDVDISGDTTSTNNSALKRENDCNGTRQNFQSETRLVREKKWRCLNGPVLFGTFGVLLAIFLVGFVPRWRVNAALTNSIRDQRPTVSVISSQRPADNANLVLPGSTQAIQETAIYAPTNGYVRKWNVDIGRKIETGQLLAEVETPEVDQELNQARANVAQATANADLARATLTRWQQFVDQKVVSPQEFDEKKSAADARRPIFKLRRQT